MEERPSPIAFWMGREIQEEGFTPKPYIDPELQEGTTPLVKLMGYIATRNFKNSHHPGIQERDFGGPRAILYNRYKLVIHGEANAEALRELFDER